MGFAGSFAAGVDQAGFDIISKREPARFKGFGMDSMLYNMPDVEGQVADPEDWDLPTEPVELLYGCPPCSGFSQLSFANTLIQGATVGPDAAINECMVWMMDYAARVKPKVVILESVGVAFKSGRDWMEGLWERLRARSGIDYQLTHVVMNSALVGGDVIRPRYFLVAHTEPFGVGLDFVAPRTVAEVLADLPDATDPDPDWGHQILRRSVDRWSQTIKWLEAQGLEWRQGTRLPDNNGVVAGEPLDPPDFWIKPNGKSTERSRRVMGSDIPVYSHWFSTDPFSTYRWRADRPYGVVVGAVLDRAIHPTHARNFTWREAARFMSLPDSWSLRKLVEANDGAQLGKAVTSAAGKWIAHWAKMSLEGTPGEYAGQPTDKPMIRTIEVQTQNRVDDILAKPPAGCFWTGDIADPDPRTWLIDRKQRPAEWPQREWAGIKHLGDAMQNPAIPKRKKAGASGNALGPKAKAQAPERQSAPPAPEARGGEITRVPPETVASWLAENKLTKQQAAERLGVSVSRVNELTTHARPKSWLNAVREDEVKEALSS